MLKFRRLFWKFFFAFWFANLLIMFATMYVVTHLMESERFAERHKAMLTAVSLRIITQHELGVPFSQGLHERHKLFSKPDIRQFPRHQHFRIYDGEELIFSSGPRNGFRHKKMHIPVRSPSGKTYQVSASVGPPPHFLVDAIRHFTSLQFIFILLASMLVSVLLSWVVTRPLKALGAYSRHYAEGDLSKDIDATLLGRGDELGDLARDFNFMRQEIEKHIQAQKELLHDVSHELRAPLARLQVAAELIKREESKSVGHADRIHMECERIDHLIQQILDFSRMGSELNDFADLNVVELVGEQIENIRYEYSDRTINFDGDSDRIVLSSNKKYIARAIENILRNACNHTQEASAIDVFIEKDEDKVVINIRDHGHGVKESELDRLLTPFYRSGNKMHTAGFGLGLSIAQRAIKMCGGDIHLKNHIEGGLLVSLELPCACPADPANL